MTDEEQKAYPEDVATYLEDVATVRRTMVDMCGVTCPSCDHDPVCGEDVSDQEVVEFLEALRDQGLELRRIVK